MGSDETTVPGSQRPRAPRARRLGVLWVFPDNVLRRDGPGPYFTEIGERAVVGRSAEADIVLEAAQVSRRHALLRRDGAVLLAEDLGSRNGTHHDGRRVDTVALEPGAVLRLGEAIAVVHVAGEEPCFGFEFGELAPGVLGGATLRERLGALRRVAASELSVIVAGRTGTGKEGVARAVHHFSGRRGKLVAINCATLPEALAEAQLFGHKRGAFTGAERSEHGYIGAADGGTLFLDEVLELAPSIQARLLRVLQQREYVPLGETRAVPVDLRVVAACQEPLEAAVRAGKLREDLYARLDGYQLALPDLGERKEDIPFLFRHFLAERFGGRPPALRARLVEALLAHAWPRNVRELETVARRIGTLHGHHPELDLEHLADVLDIHRDATNAVSPAPCAPAAPPRTAVAGEEAALVAALHEHGGNVVRAAKQLGMSRAKVYRLMAALGVDAQRYRKRSLDEPA